MACFSASVVWGSPVAGFIRGFCVGHLIGSAAIGKAGSSSSLSSSSTWATGMGVAGVPWSLGDLLTGCLADAASCG